MLITTTTYGTYPLQFKTKSADQDLKKLKNTSYSLAFDEIDIADLSGYACDVSVDYGKISITKSNVDVLGTHDDKAIPADNLNSLILVG